MHAYLSASRNALKTKDCFKIDRIISLAGCTHESILLLYYYCPLCCCHEIVTRARSEAGWAQ